MQPPKNKNLFLIIKCLAKGHMSRQSSCPFTNQKYEICDRCGKTSVIHKEWIY